MRPHVVAQLAVSVDGATSGFSVDQARFYALATLWQEDVTLTGADTILAQEDAIRAAKQPGPKESGPLLAVTDSRARVRSYEALGQLGYWSGVLALYADQSPARPVDSTTPELITGYDRVDLDDVLGRLGKRGAEVVRVDSGGALLNALLDQDLVDELCLLIHPVIVGTATRWSPPATRLTLAGTQSFEGGLTWLRYCVAGRTRREI